MTKVTVGVDIGGTSAKIGAVGDDGTPVATTAIPTGKSISAESFATSLRSALEELSNAHELSIDGVGVGSAGLIDTERGLVRLSPNLPEWRDVPLRDRLEETLGRPVALLNDADAFAFGEATWGAGAGAACGLYVTLGTGVGGAIVVGGDLFRGAFGMAGEVGHITFDPKGAPCACGGRGCIETIVGAAPIVERAKRHVRSGADGSAIRNAAGDGPVTPSAIAAAAAAGDTTAIHVFREVGEALGLFLVGMSNLLSLDVIVIGGGVAGAGEPLFAPLRAAFERHVMAPPDARPRIAPADRGADAGWVGAAAFARRAAGG